MTARSLGAAVLMGLGDLLAPGCGHAEDFCDTSAWMQSVESPETYVKAIKGIRDHCKVGDLIYISGGIAVAIGELCDLNRPTAFTSGGGVCFLAPPRRKY